MAKGKEIKSGSQIISPCYNRETGEDCKKRAVGCHDKCNRYKIYRILKEVERKQNKQKKADDIYAGYVAEKIARIEKAKRGKSEK